MDLGEIVSLHSLCVRRYLNGQLLLIGFQYTVRLLVIFGHFMCKLFSFYVHM